MGQIDEPIARIEALVADLAHRGPDSEGLWHEADGTVWLGHRRLSIVDLTDTGAQPMVSESGRYVITYNGEVYNFLELRRELEANGHRFRGTSDTEVLLAAIERWGTPSAALRFNGMFAFGLWDREMRSLALVRDRLGVKPLFYLFHKNGIAFSSELTRSFSALSSRTVDRDALSTYLVRHYVPEPRSIYKEVYKVPPGTIATITPGIRAIEIVPYWSAVRQVAEKIRTRRPVPDAKALVRLESTLRSSVRRHMIADVPVGAFLSGGIDSSLIVACMQRETTRKVRTYTIGFPDLAHNEAPQARQIAAYLGTDHSEYCVTEQEALAAIPQLPTIFGEPFGDSSQIPTLLVAKMTRGHVTVALSGDGGDELFGGYSNYLSAARFDAATKWIPAPAFLLTAHVLARMPRWLQRGEIGRKAHRATRLGAHKWEKYLPTCSDPSLSPRDCLVVGHPYTAPLVFPDILATSAERLMCQDLVDYLPNDILVKVDRASMAVSLEVRAPFVDDHELFDLAWDLGVKHKINDHGGKALLKRLLAKWVPKTLWSRPKHGFGVPLRKWLLADLRDWVESCTDPHVLRQDGYLDVDKVAELKRRASKGDMNCIYSLWSLCVFQTWLRH